MDKQTENYILANRWLKKMIDPEMKTAVMDYCKKELLEYTGSSPLKVKADQCLRQIGKQMYLLYLEDLTYDMAVELIKNTPPGKGQLQELVRFLAYLFKTGRFRNTSMYRLAELEDYFLSTVLRTPSKVLYVLNDDDYEQYKGSMLYRKRNQKNGYEAYFVHVEAEDFKDSATYNVVNGYLQRIKMTTAASPVMFLRLAYGIKYSSRELLKDRHPCELTAEDVMEYITDYTAQYKPAFRQNILQGMYLLLAELCRLGMITDKKINTLSSLYIRETGLLCDTAIKVLSYDHPEYWTLWTTAGGAHADEKHITYINIADPEIRQSFADFLAEYAHTEASISLLANEFEKPLSGPLHSFEDFDFTTYTKQLAYFDRADIKERSHKRRSAAVSAVTAYYAYINQHFNSVLFEKNGIPNSILLRTDITDLILSGYDVVVYNPMTPVPDSDKWLLCYNIRRQDPVVETWCTDFTSITCPLYRQWIKNYIWQADVLVETKRHPLPVMRHAMNYLYDIKRGKQKSIFARPTKDLETIYPNEIVAYRNSVLSTWKNKRTQISYIYGLRNLLNFVDLEKLGNIDPGIYYTLTHVADNNYDNAGPLSDEELRRFTHVVKEKATVSVINGIMYGIIYLALETEFREKTLLTLPRDCLKETAKHGEYVLITDTKTTAQELQEHPITAYAAREVKELIRLTETYRENCTDPYLASRLLIVPALKRGMYRSPYPEMVNKFLASCCDEAGIPRYTMSNLRDTHMTNAERMRIKKQLSEMEQSILTGHTSSDMDDKHYVHFDIREMLESVHGIIIGNVNINGQVVENQSLSPEIKNDDNLVSDKCGYCKSCECRDMSYLDCLVCKDFVTTPDRLPFFMRRIREIEHDIENATIPHDKEDLVNIKRLLLRFVEEIYKKGGVTYATD